MKTFDLGAVTAYALAVKYGFKGTEKEWVDYMQANAAEAKAAEARAQAAAETAEGSETNAGMSAQNAAKSAEEAKESAANAKGVADWHAAEGEPGHVLNRTHYVEQGMVEILPECQPNYSEDDRAFLITENVPTIVIGETYTVNWNGTDYTATAISGAGSFDDDSVMLINDGTNMETGEGAVFMIVFQRGVLLVMSIDGTTELTISIKGMGEVVHKLDGKFLPNGVPWVEQGVMVEILPETQAVAEDDGLILLGAPSLTGGETYTVKWNGTEYQSLAIDGADLGEPGIIVLGDVYTSSGGQFGSESTGEPFVLMIVPEAGLTIVNPFEWTEGDPLPTVAIYGAGATIHKIDPRCLPDDVGGVKLYDVPFELTISGSEITATTEKTFSEIYAKANEQNTIVRGVGDIGVGKIIFNVSAIHEEMVRFYAMEPSGDNGQAYFITVSSDNTVTYKNVTIPG